MPRKGYRPEEIIAELREADVPLGQGKRVAEVVKALGVSKRRACRALGQHRSVQRHAARRRPDEEALTAAIVGLASLYGRYGYRRVTALLRAAGRRVNAKRVERVWRREGLEVPRR